MVLFQNYPNDVVLVLTFRLSKNIDIIFCNHVSKQCTIYFLEVNIFNKKPTIILHY